MSERPAASWTMHHLYPDVPPGACSPGRISLGYEESSPWVVIEADPVVYASGQLLRELHQGAPEFVSLECQYPKCAEDHLYGHCCHIGDIICITGDNMRLLYVVTRRMHHDPLIAELRWPD